MEILKWARETIVKGYWTGCSANLRKFFWSVFTNVLETAYITSVKLWFEIAKLSDIWPETAFSCADTGLHLFSWIWLILQVRHFCVIQPVLCFVLFHLLSCNLLSFILLLAYDPSVSYMSSLSPPPVFVIQLAKHSWRIQVNGIVKIMFRNSLFLQFVFWNRVRNPN